MQHQSHDHEKKSVGAEEIKNKPFFDRGNASLKSSETNNRKQLFKPSRPPAHPEIKRGDAISAERLERRESLLQIRSPRESNQSTNTNDEQSSKVTINEMKTNGKLYWDSNAQEYFFDRHRACFESILYYYQSNGRLRRPDFVPLDTFLEKISFFELGSKATDQIHKTENISVIEKIQMPRMLWRRYIWFYFEFPQHSSLARFISLLSLFFTVLSCMAIAVESLPTYNDRWDNICKEQANISLNSTYVPRCSAIFTSPFFIIQSVCIVYFTIEFLFRLISTPSYFRFLMSLFNWIDLGSIVPYFVILIIQLSNEDMNFNDDAVAGVRLLRFLRFSRIFKLYLVFKRLRTFRVLSSTIKESRMDFLIMITILTLVAFLFGAATYFAEQEVNGDVFDSIPKATYWGIVTITGVGYGDMYPITAVGRVVTCLCALVGAGMMGMLVSVLVDRYQRVNNRKMYVPAKHEMSSAEFHRLCSGQSDIQTDFPSRKSSRRRYMPSALSHRLSSMYKKSKQDQRRPSSQSYKVQFTVSFDGEDMDNNKADKMVNTMKEKVTEVLSNPNNGVNLNVIDNKNNEVWTTFISDTPRGSTANLIITSNDENTQTPRSQAF